MTDEIKLGNRNNNQDRGRIRAIRQAARSIDALTIEMEPDDVDIVETESEVHEIDISKSFVSFGGECKSFVDTEGSTHVGGYLVRFTNSDDPDLTGDYFTAQTDFGLADEGHPIPVYFNHGQPIRSRDNGEVVITRRIGKGTLSVDDAGLLIDAIIYNRDEYEQAITSQVKNLGWSSGALGHLVERVPEDKAFWVKRWVIGEASLTPTPAEPKNQAIPLKSLIPAEDAQPETPVSVVLDAEAVIETKSITSTKQESKMDELELKALIADTAKAAVEEYRKSEPAKATPAVTVVVDETEQPFKSNGEFFQAVKNAALYPSAADKKLRSLAVGPDGQKATGLSEGVPADGGYLIPPATASGILEKMYSTGKILSALTIDPVSGNSMTYNAIDETTRVAGSRLGGVLGYWVAEAGAPTSSKPKFRQIELKLKKVGALCYATEEQLEDTANLEAWLNRAVPEELKFMVEDAIYEGDGVGKPLGILNAPCLVSQLRYALLGVAFVDVINMWARRYPGVSDYAWFVNTEVMPQLDQLVLASSTEIPLRFIEYDANGVMRMKGKPVIEVEYASALGTVGDIVLASMSQYQAISKGGIKAASSIHVSFAAGETAFRFVYRIDGEPSWHSALTPFKGSATQSPFVALATATA